MKTTPIHIWQRIGTVLLGSLLGALSVPNVTLAACEDPPTPQVNWTGCNKESLNLTTMNLRGAVLQKANLTGAALIGVNLQEADLTGVNALSANLSTTDLSRASLNGANLTGANLTKTRLIGADLTEVTGLTPQQLASAILDETTELPDGLRARQ